MIDCVTIANSHLFGDALASSHRLRYRVFIERQQWDVPHWDGMEYDNYDTLAASYLIYRDDDGVARGISRLSPTDRPYMLKDVWPDMVTREALPTDRRIWEGTRIGVDRDLSPDQRKKVLGELICAYMEFGVAHDLDWIIGVMPTLIIRSLFVRSGWHVELLGEPRVLGGDKVCAGKLKVDASVLPKIRARFGLDGPVLRTAADLDVRPAGLAGQAA